MSRGNHVKKLFLTASATFIGCTPFGSTAEQHKGVQTMNFDAYTCVNTLDALRALFPSSPKEIETLAAQVKQYAKRGLDVILALESQKRNFENTMVAFDRLSDTIGSITSPIHILEMVSPDDSLREASRTAIEDLNKFLVDLLESVEVYRAFNEYASHNAKTESLTKEQRYALDETMLGLKIKGLDRTPEEIEINKELRKKIASCSLQYSANIAQDNSELAVHPEALVGLHADFVAQLACDEQGRCLLRCDYPTHSEIMSHCESPDVRRDFYRVFANRAYPQNKVLLEEIIALRDELARNLGFDSFAHYNLAEEMVETPERAHEFILDIYERLNGKASEEFAAFTRELPQGVKLDVQGKLAPWDVEYVKAKYKHKHYRIDERAVAEYFPLESTITGLFDIYQQFFSLRFEIAPLNGLWDEALTLIKVFDKQSNELLGMVMLDLYPRPNKYSHACHVGFLNSMYYLDQQTGARVRRPSIGLVIANFPKPTADKPSLLKHSDVVTFFHEFGHAMHHLLGATDLASTSGTNVKRDFVELPSQMFENWMWDKDILKQVARHFQSGEPLSDEMIGNMIALKQYDAGMFDQRQCYLSLISLLFYGAGAQKNTDALLKEIIEQHSPYISFDEQNHMQASFGHLTGYGARYYGYQWSRVFAQDVFEQIETEGMLNPQAGTRLVREILSRGGSVDPNELLRNYLGREPRADAFFADMGISK